MYFYVKLSSREKGVSIYVKLGSREIRPMYFYVKLGSREIRFTGNEVSATNDIILYMHK